jgi:hypothetical protein
MTELIETVADVGSLDRTIKKVASPGEVERAAIRELVVAARARGEDLTGPDGLTDLRAILAHLGLTAHVTAWPTAPCSAPPIGRS